MSTDLHPNPRLEERLREAFDVVIPQLMDDHVEPTIRDDERSDEREWDRVPTSEPRRRSGLLGVAAAVLLVGGGAAVWSASTRPEPTSVDPATAASVDVSTATSAPSLPNLVESTVPPIAMTSTASSVPCLIEDCTPVDRLPVVDGAFDLYAGPESLGTPDISQDMLDQFGLVRCLELTADGSACQRIEGLAGVALVGYSSIGVGIGTTFTSISAADYVAQWSVSGSGTAPTEDVVVRGHAGIRYSYGDRDYVVWPERDGMLAWVVAPSSLSDELLPIAEGVRTLDGPTTIPHLIVAGLGSPWDASDNDSDGVVYARIGDALCVGIGWVPEPCSRVVTRRTSDGSGALQIAGIGPRSAATARVELDDGSSYDFVLTAVHGIADERGFLGALPAVEGSLTLSWLDAAGAVQAAERIDVGGDRSTVVATTVPSGEEVQSSSEGWGDGAALRVYFVNGASDSEVAAVRDALLAHPEIIDVERLTYLDEAASLEVARLELAAQPDGLAGLNESNVPSRLNVFSAPGVPGTEVAVLVEELGIESFTAVVSVARPDA